MPTIHPNDLSQLHAEDSPVRLIDVRTPGEYDGRRIKGSVNVPLADIDGHRAQLVDCSEPIVLVCESGRRAGIARDRLREAGIDARVLTGGVVAWEQEGLHLDRQQQGKARWTLERQVRLVAGAIVAVSIVASLAWLPARFLAGAIGAGLVFAALTDTCALGMALGRLPYNRGATCSVPALATPRTEDAR